MSGKGKRAAGKGTVVIRREEGGGEGHHGGAWKVAYADFVTAMMAFFLLMWLINATTEDQRRGLADYFAPTSVLGRAASGTGLPFGGRTPHERGDMASDRGAVAVVSPRLALAPDPEEEEDPDAAAEPRAPNTFRNTGTERGAATGNAVLPGPQEGPRAPGGGPALADAAAPVARPQAETLLHAESLRAQARAEQDARERQAFREAAEQIREAVRGDPRLAELAHQLAIDETPEGLRIQILDEERRPMFATGSAAPNERARMLLQKVAPVLARLSEPVSIAGHTDAAPFRGGERSNWELSAERANATRRLLVEAGLQEARLRSVTGNADRDPLLPADPLAPANRRIAIVVLRGAGGS